MPPDPTPTPRIAVVGSTMIDLIAYVDRVPAAGETVIGRRFSQGFGGKGANQAVMAARLGAQVAMVACVGDDAFGQQTLDNLVEMGVDTAHVRQVPGTSGIAPIWVEADGSNRIVIVPGANDELTADAAVSAITALAHVDVVVGQLEVPQPATTAAFEAARRRGAVTILNPAPFAPLSTELLAATDWLVPNEVELEGLVGPVDPNDDTALEGAVRALGPRLLVTLGAAGAVLVGEGAVVRVPAPSVDAVDSTGAGDAFIGAFAVGMALGRGVEASIDLGVRCASDSVTRPGTQSSFPDRKRCTTLLSGATS
ncbi:ribokinase [Euzebya sp.]|uniref:ribokinase n=1 Tax=Euzebya sp. TaxID=1971409 RepID=UPI003515E610